MQTFNLINAQDRVKKSRATINANFEAVASNFSGIAFPTVNLYVGMKCYRTDLNQTFTLNNVELQTWVDDSDIADKAITTEKLADQSVTNGKIAPSAITTEKITNAAVTTDKIASRSITQDKIAIGILTAHNVGAYTQNEVYNKGELFNRTESDNRYYQKAQTYSKAEIYNRGEVDDKMNTRVSKSGDTMTANLRFSGANVGLTSDSGYIQFNGTDTGDAISGGNGANINIGSWLGLGFYSTYTKKYTGTMDLRSGNWRTIGELTANTFKTSNWFRSSGGSGWYNETHEGGIWMNDKDWIRTYGGKNFYCDRIIRSDVAFETNKNGRGFVFTYNGTPIKSIFLSSDNVLKTDADFVSPNIYTNDWFRVNGNGGIHWQNYGGGWHMTDSAWIRSYGNKNIFTAGKMKAVGGFEGTATNANKLQDWSLQNILDEFLNVWHSNKTYTVGDIAFHKYLPSWARLECVQAGTTGNNANIFSTNVIIGQYIQDGSCKWIVDDVRDCNRVGTVIGSLYLPDGYVKADGRTVNRVAYPRLVTLADKYNLWTNDTAANLGLFGRGNGSTTMILPNWIDRMAQFAAQGGTTIAAGLPNITGGINDNPFRTEKFGGGYGALVDSVDDRSTGGGAGYYGPATKIRFDASKSNPIYGRSSTVQPPAIKMIPCIKY